MPIAQDLLRNYHRKDVSPRCTIKVDLQKAYDTVGWSFLLDLLLLLGFPTRFINWIRVCLSTSKFSININGELVGFFSSSRGLRQGDLLSSYLFVIIMELLSMMLNKKTSEA